MIAKISALKVDFEKLSKWSLISRISVRLGSILSQRSQSNGLILKTVFNEEIDLIYFGDWHS